MVCKITSLPQLKTVLKPANPCAAAQLRTNSASYAMTKHKVLQTPVRPSVPPPLLPPLLPSLRASVLWAIARSALSGITVGLVWTGGCFSVPLAGPFVTGPFAGGLFDPVRSQAIAQQISPQVRQYFLSDPLTTQPRDSFLPVISVDRPLSPLELRDFSAKVEELDQSAQQLLASGQVDEAFALWRRELRLRRVLGPIEEFNAIMKVAELAWDAQRPVEVQLLTLRTREIWATLQVALGVATTDEAFAEASAGDGAAPASALVSGQSASDIATLSALAETFTTLRDVDSAVEVYSQIIELRSSQGDEPTEQRRSLAELHLQWFQFAEAANIYLALLATARESGDSAAEIDYLERLIYSYQQANSLPNAIRAQSDLLAIYQDPAQGAEEKLPELLLATAQNYRALNRPDNAIEYYRSAYSAAQRFNQFSFSAQVLKDLGALYEAIALNTEALGAYNLLVPVEQQAYNFYGVMNAYDSIGQLQRRQGNSLEALKAFEQALVIANQLNLNEDYFIEQIQSVSQPAGE
jgi:tetratricopeptide (TPR) repeat protein